MDLGNNYDPISDEYYDDLVTEQFEAQPEED